MSKEKEVKKKSEKVMTKYEKKQAARLAQQKKDEKAARITRLAVLFVCICVIGAIGFSIGSPIIRRQKAINDVYVKVGNYDVTKVEYDFYYNTVVNNYLNMYSSILPYMGFDASKDFAEQQYDESKSWKDAFDEMTVEQLKQVKALIDDSQAQGFTYDTAEDYKEFQDNLTTAASEAETNIKEYYKKNYGEYATEERIAPFEKETLLAAAYFKELLEKNKPSDEEVASYYEENKADYDVVDYRSFAFSATIGEDAGDEEKAAAMEVVKASAEDMRTRREAGEDFEALCVQYATEDNKAAYESEETEQSLTTNARKSSVSSAYSDWLFEAERKEGDLMVVSDEANNQYHVVEFVSRSKDETADTSISDTLAQQRAGEYIDNLAGTYDITDVAGELKYLAIPEQTVSDNQTESTEETEGAEDTENAEGAEDTEGTENAGSDGQAEEAGGEVQEEQ